MTPEFGVNPTGFLLQNSFLVFAKGGVWANGGENDGGVTLVLDGHGYSWVDKKVLRV